MQPPELDGYDGRPGPDKELADIRAAQGHIVGGQQYCGAAQQKVAPFHRSTGTSLLSLIIFLFSLLFSKY